MEKLKFPKSFLAMSDIPDAQSECFDTTVTLQMAYLRLGSLLEGKVINWNL